MNELHATEVSTAGWERLRPMLYEVMDKLGEQDRGVVLLRFFARQRFAEIGATLKLSEDAARMRVDRALEKLRVALNRRGVVSTGSALATMLAHHAVVVAPAGLSALATSAALSGGGALAGILAFMSITKFQIGVATAVIAAGATGLTSQQRRVDELRAAGDALQSQLDQQTRENASLAKARADSDAQIAVLRGEIALLKSSASSAARPSMGSAPARATPSDAAGASAQTNTEGRVSRLNTLVGLTPEQQARVAEIFRQEAVALEAFAPGEERAIKGADARQASRAALRALLTPEQRQKYDVSPQTLGGGLPADPASLVTRLDQVVALTGDQKQKATAILWNDLMEQIASIPADQALPGFRWRDKVRDRLRAVLTPEQQAKFDGTAPYRKSGASGSAR